MIWSLLLLLASLILVDIYGFRGMRKLFSHRKLTPLRYFMLRSYWIVDIAFLLFAIGWALYIRNSNLEEYQKYRKFFWLMGGFMLIFIPKASFFLFTVFYDLKLLFIGVNRRIFYRNARFYTLLSGWRNSLIVPAIGFVFAVLMFTITLHGVGFGRFNFNVVEQQVWFDDLPDSFDGYRVVQFSDTHLGSYSQTAAVQTGLKIINYLAPDLIVFTGDMVNNEALEAVKFIPYFQELRATDGLFSVLGNHDMGDYRRWGTIAEKEANIQHLVDVQREMGFQVLLNDNVLIFRGNDSIMIAGVENWGLPPFAQYGDLNKALSDKGTETTFTVLLSHDPSHWRAQVIPDSDVHLTLSGHTHGMQFGISNRFFSWSPVQLKYNEWSGLYQAGNQKLYVNTGFGFLSFPGRIGMPPEITLIILRKNQKILADQPEIGKQ
jgi:uncharacterized protein